MYKNYVSSEKITKHGPVLTRHDIPYPAALIFNAGVTKFKGKYIMTFRNDYGSYEEHRLDGTNIGLAFSDDGISWQVSDKPCFSMHDDEIIRVYDPRLTVIEGRCYMCFAADTRHGLRSGIAVTDDFESFEVISLSLPDNRNSVLFPEKINGLFVKLDRPMPVYSRGGRDRFDTWISYSPDLKYWGDHRLLMSVEDVPFANDKIGPGAPPVKTDAGWLTLFHAVIRDNERGKHGWEDRWQKVYFAGVALLDKDDPSRVVGICKSPLIAPDMPYESEEGFRTDVIFPGGLVKEDDGTVKIYYGAADTVECLATASCDELIRLCLENKQ